MNIKKAELHVHLEGTISPRLAKMLAIRNSLVLPDKLISPDGKSYQYRDFLDFLAVYDQVAAVIKKPQDYYDITYDYLKNTAIDGGIYVEMMYSPDHAEQSSGIPSIEHLYAIQQAIDDAETKHSITGNILITAVRHFGAEAAEKVAKQALIDKLPCVVGFGLGGDEFNFPPKLFKRAYEIAFTGGLMCTAHAGEFDSATGIIEAMDNLPIQRIGHGVMAMHCQETISRIIDKNLTLEICPNSNIALKLFPDLKSHPLQSFMQAGINVCLNSDDPPFFNTTLAYEYQQVQNLYRLNDDQMNAFTKTAIEAAFIGDSQKKALLQRL